MIVESWFKNNHLVISPPNIWNMPNLFHSCVVFILYPLKGELTSPYSMCIWGWVDHTTGLSPKFPLTATNRQLSWHALGAYMESTFGTCTNVQLEWLDMRNPRPAKKEPLHCHTRWAPDTVVIIVINGVMGPSKWPYKWVTGVITLLSRSGPRSEVVTYRKAMPYAFFFLALWAAWCLLWISP